MDKQSIKDKMHEYGFTFNLESRNGKGETTALYFMAEPRYYNRHKDRIMVPSYNCTIYPETDEFEFTYNVPGSINTLSTPKCSPFRKEDHFNNICVKFESAVQVLHMGFGQ